jgi:hypothetical protein
MTETCSHCGEPIGARELKHIKIFDGERYVFHVNRPTGPGCKREWMNANKEMIREKLALSERKTLSGLHARLTKVEDDLLRMQEQLKESGK